jgi:hypothetical protein
MKRFLSVLLVAATAFGASHAFAQSQSSTPKKVTKKASSAKKAAPAAAQEPADDDEESREPDTTGSVSTDFNCELGNKLTVFHNVDDDKHVALRWNKRIHRLTRVGTSTGANRFENRKYGLVWISIPTKSMLLDSKKGQQLANECRSAEQQKANEAPKG